MSDIKNINRQRRDLFKYSGAILGGLALGGLSKTALASSIGGGASADNTAPALIRINYNENPLGMSPKAQEAARLAIAKANRYPYQEQGLLRDKIAAMQGVDKSNVLVLQGSCEGIRSCFEALGTPETQLVIPELTYEGGPKYAKVMGMNIVRVPMSPGWKFDVAGLKKAVDAYAGPSIVYIVNPNNPTATITPADLIEPWIKSKPKDTLFLVDEAYAEFVNDDTFRSVAGLIREGYDNIVLLKTFSKIFAMAGMRVGYAIGNAGMLKKMADYNTSESLNYCAIEAASVSLDDKEFISYSKKTIDTSRQILISALKKLDLEYLPSEANFLFHRISVPLASYQQKMKEHGVIIGRAFPPATDWCRISMGTPEEMGRFTQLMFDFREKGWL
ncbi:aminotransferase class I/II-fold pyridoxal phosphate-dependent enzyme [Brenneria izadpanahii]|uniref:Aminotransferase class I/II-fold pyridoxal phosphate-dependent enzyme n=1 Tax=Brenneria izadpanahii TaxID=2722756 RepID=A0ABX7UUT3_9GAMM|nr:aminotransferase class I/II-fold pyridoxal phosphate-dependent enzyme [Brenneria izadpanahii]QTF09055.1 aminotransferase class I/II-fold pyridoxal phosphate-dependent enzyme [Brenneria izadpanahii]